MRAGIGYDIHRLAAGRRLILGGVAVPFEKGLSGHSDADVVIHAVMDALLGAAGMKDIGFHFSPEDPAYRDISSVVLLKRVAAMLESKNFTVCNVDATIIAEKPKLAPYIDDMRSTISRALRMDAGCVMVKVTTNEGIGCIGEGEGIAAFAVAALDEKKA